MFVNVHVHIVLALRCIVAPVSVTFEHFVACVQCFVNGETAIRFELGLTTRPLAQEGAVLQMVLAVMSQRIASAKCGLARSIEVTLKWSVASMLPLMVLVLSFVFGSKRTARPRAIDQNFPFVCGQVTSQSEFTSEQRITPWPGTGHELFGCQFGMLFFYVRTKLIGSVKCLLTTTRRTFKRFESSMNEIDVLVESPLAFGFVRTFWPGTVDRDVVHSYRFRCTSFTRCGRTLSCLFASLFLNFSKLFLIIMAKFRQIFPTADALDRLTHKRLNFVFITFRAR